MAFVAGAEPAVAGQPAHGALDHPSVAPKPFTGLDALAGDPHANALATDPFSQVGLVVRLVGVELAGFVVPAAFGVVSRLEPGDHGLQPLAVVGVAT